MENVFLIGRIVFSMLFIGSGIGHLTDTEGSAQYAQSKGIGNARAMVQLSGVTFLLGGSAIALGVFTDLAFLLIGLQVLILAFVMHPFWKLDGAEQQAEMPHFMKNLSLFGACLMGFAFFSSLGAVDDAKQLVGPLFDVDWN
ncbi:MAG: DoxX family protein [Acidimicrobiales bacterium]